VISQITQALQGTRFVGPSSHRGDGSGANRLELAMMQARSRAASPSDSGNLLLIDFVRYGVRDPNAKVRVVQPRGRPA